MYSLYTIPCSTLLSVCVYLSSPLATLLPFRWSPLTDWSSVCSPVARRALLNVLTYIQCRWGRTLLVPCVPYSQPLFSVNLSLSAIPCRPACFLWETHSDMCRRVQASPARPCERLAGGVRQTEQRQEDEAAREGEKKEEGRCVTEE